MINDTKSFDDDYFIFLEKTWVNEMLLFQEINASNSINEIYQQSRKKDEFNSQKINSGKSKRSIDGIIQEFHTRISLILTSLEESLDNNIDTKAKAKLLTIERSALELRGLFNNLMNIPKPGDRERVDEKYISLDQRFMKKALSVVNTYYMDSDFDVKEFSRKMNLSPTQLHRKIKKQTNTSVGKFIQTIRLSKAATLLRNKTDNVTNIAYDTGFKNLSWFAKMFKQKFGVSPSRYAKLFEE